MFDSFIRYVCQAKDGEGKWDSEGKDSKDAKDSKYDEPAPHVHVSDVRIEPNHCPLTSPLSLSLDYSLDKPVRAGFWELKVVTPHASDYVLTWP